MFTLKYKKLNINLMQTKLNLKITLLVVFLLSFASVLYSQPKVEVVNHYLFPEFTKGTVLLKSGARNEALLNYNSITEEMIFKKGETELALNQLELIDTVFILNKKFIPIKNIFVQVIYKGNLELYAQHRCRIIDPGKNAGYGGTSSTSAITNFSSFHSRGHLYEMKLPDNVETSPYVEYLLKRDGKLHKFTNVKQLSTIFKAKSHQYKTYTKDHSVKYTDENSLVELIKYMDSI